jgi:hypothetical protein
MDRLEKFWAIRGYCPYRMHEAHVREGDARSAGAFKALGLEQDSVDAIITSPPYATALPYIDTDRLSLLVLLGLNVTARRPLESSMVGSREISISERRAWDGRIRDGGSEGVPNEITRFVRALHRANTGGGAGFRRQNLPSLLLRFFSDMLLVFRNCAGVLRPGGEAMMVVGDNVTEVRGLKRRIPTTDFVALLGRSVGLTLVERIPITVTTEHYVHLGNAITRNEVIRFRRPAARRSRSTARDCS